MSATAQRFVALFPVSCTVPQSMARLGSWCYSDSPPYPDGANAFHDLQRKFFELGVIHLPGCFAIVFERGRGEMLGT